MAWFVLKADGQGLMYLKITVYIGNSFEVTKTVFHLKHYAV